MEEGEAAADETGAPLYVWIGLSVIAAISFWVQATVTEERFVPALNVIADFYNIPDDIAGATLMAAGASSPELFSSITALFITHSALGLGTIVGSEIFNQLIICAGAVFAAKSDGLKLDPAIVTREVGFYALSIILLYAALKDSRPDPDDDSGIDHIYISFWEACYVFAGYVAYVIVCAKMEDIVSFFQSFTDSSELQDLRSGMKGYEDLRSGMKGYGSSGRISNVSFKDVQLPFIQQKSLIKNEPSGNFKTVELSRASLLAGGVPENWAESSRGGSFGLSDRVTAFLSQRGGDMKLSLRPYLVRKERPSDEHSLYDIEANAVEGRLSCFLWQRSYFYNKAKFAKKGWHLRWFSLKDGTMSSVPDRGNAEHHKMTYPAFEHVEVDEEKLIIRVIHPVPNRRNYYLMAPSQDIFEAVLVKMEKVMEERATRSLEAPVEEEDANIEFEAEANESMIEWPVDTSLITEIFFVLLFPFRALMHYTLPDVRVLDPEGNPTAHLSTAFLAITSCLLWLIVGSYAMVASLEALADLMQIPDAVVGVTVSAAGTSLPNYVASKIAAERGFGNMAVSNAFGSNTFNIMIGLGLPWLLYTSFGTGFKPYHGLRDEGIVDSVLILGSVLLVFVVVVLTNNFVLKKWHGILFIVLYIAYLAFEIGRVYVS